MPLDVELAEIRDFLAAHPPFDELPQPVLTRLPSQLAVEYHRRGSVLIARGQSPSDLLVVRSGAVEVHDRDGLLVERGEPGTCLGGEALVTGRPSEVEVTAMEDTLVLAVPSAVFDRLRAEHEAVDRFFRPAGGERLQEAVARRNGGQEVLRTTVRHLLGRPPVAVPVTATVREAARTMADERVSSLLVMDGDRLAGILTDRDLRTRVLAAGADPDGPVSGVMTPDPVTVDAGTVALEVLVELVARNIHHLPVVEAGRTVGMVTATDLLRLAQANPVFLVGDVQKAGDVAEVARLAGRLPRIVESLVAQDATADDIGRVVTLVGDAVERRLLALAEDRYGAPPVPYAWLTLGSRARLEQSLNADQDHALLLHDEVRDEHASYFADIAQFVTDGLVEAGYPLCRGEKMATNPRWRQPLGAWRRTFSGWLARPSPEAVLEASVFFDLRRVNGDEDLVAALQDHVRREARRASLFLAHLAKEAAMQHPPIGFFRGLVVEKAGQHRHTLDVKQGGAGIVVKLARVHALGVGSPATNSRTRLADAVRAGVVSEPLGADLLDAWEFLSYVRLRHQAACVNRGVPPDNHVRPDDLSSFEKRHLREAFAVVRRAQQALEQRYPLHHVP